MTSFKSNIFHLSVESLKFLKIFQLLGCMPIKLVDHEGFSCFVSPIVLMVITIVITVIRFLYPSNNYITILLFLWDIITILFGIIVNVVTISRQKRIMILIGEIDSNAIKLVSLWNQLEKRNVKFHQQLVVLWIVYLTFTLYGPISKAVNADYSEQFYDSLLRIIPFLLVHVNLTKILYLYGLLALKLNMIKLCVENITIDAEIMEKKCLIGEILRNKVLKNMTTNSNLLTLKEMYRNCWKLQDEINLISNLFLMLHFIGYVGQICYVIFFYVQAAIMNQQLLMLVFGNFLHNSLMCVCFNIIFCIFFL